MYKSSIAFMDYDNIWITGENHLNINIFNSNFIQKINSFFNDKGYKLNEFIAYGNYDNGKMKKDYHQTKLQELGVQTRHCRNGKDSADIYMTCDVLEKLYLTAKDNETYIIISCDKDIAPLINKLKSQGKEVILVTFTVNVDWNVMKNYGDSHFWFEEIIGMDYLEPKSIIELDKTSFIEELRNQLESRKTDINYSLFAQALKKKYNVNGDIIDSIKDFHIKEGTINIYDYEFRGTIYHDGIKFK